MTLTTNELHDVATMLSERIKVDYPHFCDSFLRRRVAYMFEKMRLRRIQDLQAALASPLKFDEMAFYLSVPQTELFRFPSFWRQLRKMLAADASIRSIWLPSLSSYHELFSLLVTLDMAGRADCRIVASSVCDRVTASVRSLAVSKSEDRQNRLNFERLETRAAYEDYVVAAPDGSLSLRQGMIDGVEFRSGWFMNFEGESHDLIIFRDTLVEYGRALHVKSVARLVGSLSRPGAALCLGPVESPLGCEDELCADHAAEGIYTLRG